MRDKTLLRQLQALPLRAKIMMTQQRIREWYDHFGGNVCVSFSGGKDSTVLAHIVHEMYPKVPLVFSNTGLEYPEIQAFARKMGAEFVCPKMRFDEVISKYGYPIISKENAEAIYYARRIRNSQLPIEEVGGGGGDSANSTQEACGSEALRAERSASSGNVRIHTFCTSEGRASGQQPPVCTVEKLQAQSTSHGGKYTETVYKRDLISGSNLGRKEWIQKQTTAGSMTNGVTGDESPLPG